MARSLFAGGTNYGSQSFDDMVNDLNQWIDSLTETLTAISEPFKILSDTGYWRKIDQNFWRTAIHSKEFYKTSISEITDITEEMQHEVEMHHVLRLKKLGEEADRFNSDLGMTWGYFEERKEYGNEQFNLAELIYAQTRDMAADMLDLQNLAARLHDFVGKKNKVRNTPEQMQRDDFVSHVFISYSHSDSDYAQKLAHTLSLEGFSVWIDEKIEYGEQWFKIISKAIADSAAVIVIMSPQADDSEWVTKEILLAKREKKPIFPLLLGGKEFGLLIDIQHNDVRNGKLPSRDFYTALAKVTRK